MKRFVPLVLILFFAACEEEPPFINFTEPEKPLVDSTWVTANVPAAAYKKVLIEDITGVRCPNCPDAAITAKDIKSRKGDSVVIMALYIKSIPNFTTPWAAPNPDLRTDASQAISEGLGLPTGLPNGMIDRWQFSGQRIQAHSLWESRVNTRLKQISPVNIILTKEYNQQTKELLLTVKLTYTQDIPSGTNHKLSILMLESSIVGKQSTSSGYDDNYKHDHVLRKAITGPLGNDLNYYLERGRVILKQYKIKIDDYMNPDETEIVVIVSDYATESVVQVEEIKVY